MKKSFLQKIKKEFYPGFLRTDPEALGTYGRDGSIGTQPHPSAVVFPRSTAEVSRFLRECARFHVPVVPSGGMTGMSGGAVAAQGEVVLSLEKMDRMEKVDPVARTVRVQAGATMEAVHRHCGASGLTWPVSIASKKQCQVGGNISTNAGGLKVVRYGSTRNWVLGLQVVLMGGEVLELNGALEKNNSGYDLRQLFIGSEGTLGVVTEAVLKLAPAPGKAGTFFIALKDRAAVLRLFQRASQNPSFQVAAFEFLTRKCVGKVCEVFGLTCPVTLDAGAYVLMEVEHLSPGPQVGGRALVEPSQAADGSHRAAKGARLGWDSWLTALKKQGVIREGRWARTPEEVNAFWAVRENMSKALSSYGVQQRYDLSVPISSIDPFLGDVDAAFKKKFPGFDVFVFGHIGDGNLHVNTHKPQAMSESAFWKKSLQASKVLYGIVKKYRGSVSAEHGIGLVKKPYLLYTRTPKEVELFRSLKKLFDPKGLLNPGKIFD